MVNVDDHIRELEAALRRPWIEEDYIRSMNRVTQVSNNGNDNDEAALGDQVEQEVVHLVGDDNINEQEGIRNILFNYYRWLLRAMRFMEPYQQNPNHDSTTTLDHHDEMVFIFDEDEYESEYEEEEEEDDEGDEEVVEYLDDFPTSRIQQEGLSEETILSHLKTRDVDHKMVIGEDEDADTCCICQEDLEQQGQKIATLDCNHEYHADCIIQWLQRGTNVCPLCKAVALPAAAAAAAAAEAEADTMMRQAPVNLDGYIRQLEAALGRSWIEEDYIRTMNRVSQVYNNGNGNDEALVDAIGEELLHLLGDNLTNYSSVYDILLNYYLLLLRAMPSVEPHAVQQNHVLDSMVLIFDNDEDEDEEDEADNIVHEYDLPFV